MTALDPERIWTVTPVLANGWPEASLATSVTAADARSAAREVAGRDGAPRGAVYAVVDAGCACLELHRVARRGVRVARGAAVAGCPSSPLSEAAALSARPRLDLGFPTRPRSLRLVVDIAVLGLVGLLPMLLASEGRLADHRLAYAAGVAAALVVSGAVLACLATWFTRRIQSFAGDMQRDPAHHARLIRLATGRPKSRA